MASDKSIVPVPDVSPPRVIDRQTAIEKVERRVRGALRKNISVLEELARGVIVVEAPKPHDPWRELCLRNVDTGEVRAVAQGVRVYATPPNREALMYLIDRGMGRPPQRHEITGDEGGPVQIIPWLPAGEHVG